MTKRSTSMARLSATAATLLLSQQVAYSADTIWDLLRTGDPARSRSAKPVVLNSVIREAQSRPDRRNGSPFPVVVPGSPAAAPVKHKGGLLGFFDGVGNTMKKIGKTLNSDIRIQGQKSMGFHMENVSGGANARDAYQNDVYYGRKGIAGAYDQTDLTIEGKIGGLINFTTRYSNNLYGNPNDNRLSLNYASKNLKIDAGDIQGSITGNSLLGFTRSLKGIQISADILKGVKLTSLFSETKAQTRTITIAGGNTSGPYYVFAGQIVDGSEKVRVNNRDMIKGQDYTLDPYTGELNFKNGLIVGELDTIAVTYETYGYNQAPGVLTGWRADLSMLKNTKMGFTYLSQTSKSLGNAVRSQTEQFQGYINAASPYELRYPIDIVITQTDNLGKPVKWAPKYPMTVTIDGVPQIYDTNYFVDPYLTNRIYTRVGIPSTSTIVVNYVPQVTDDSVGNRSVMGFDVAHSLGKTGDIVAEFGTSQQALTSKTLTDSAWQLRTNMRFLRDKLNWTFNLRDIGANFASIESPGFSRTEKGFTSGLDYTISKALKFNANFERSKRPSYDYSSALTSSSTTFANVSGYDDYAQTNLGLSWQIGKAGSLNLSRSAMNTNAFNGGKSTMLSDSLTFAFSHKSFNLDLGLGRNSSSSTLITTGTTSTSNLVSQYGVNTLSSHLNMRWRANDRLSLAANLSNNAIHNIGIGSSNAQDMQLTAEVVPLRNMRMTFGFQMQDSGGSSLYNTTGTTTTTGTTASTSLAARAIALIYASRGIYYPGLSRDVYSGIGSTYPYGGTGSYSNIGYNTGILGGGYNSGLGNNGNYSGGIVSGGFSNYGLGVAGGKSRNVNFVMNYQPWQAFSMDFTWNTGSSQGDYLTNSTRNDMALNFNYNMGERLSFNSSFSVQKVSYIGGSGGMTSNLAFFNLRARPFGKLVTNLSYQTMKTDSQLASLTGTTGGSGTTLDPITGLPITNPTTVTSGFGGTNMNSYTLRLEYPIWKGNSLYFQFDNAVNSGYLAATQRTMMIGMDFPVTNNMRFTLGWRNQEHISQGSSTSQYSNDYTYRVGSLDADLNWRF